MANNGDPQKVHPELPGDLNPDVEELHCSSCGRFLAYIALVEGSLAIKCRRCKNWITLDIRQEQ